MAKNVETRKEWRKWYKSPIWQGLRRVHLHDNPLCVMCTKEGRTVAGNVVDHIKPHRGNWALFIDRLNFQTLCKRHHDSDKQIIERGGNPVGRVGADGWPIAETAVPRKTKRKI